VVSFRYKPRSGGGRGGPLIRTAAWSASLRQSVLWFVFLAAALACAQTTPQPPGPITISVDATQVAHKVLHAQLTFAARPGPLTLYYPKWMPADHSPDGPIWNLAGLKFLAAGKPVPWTQDSVDMYTFHLQVPQQVNSVTANLDFLLSAPGPTIDFSASGSSNLFILMWNQVMLYPSGWPANQIMVHPTLTVPNGWKFNTALPVAATSSNNITFKPVALDLLIDSPVQSGENMRVIPLTPGETPTHEIDVVADAPSALDIPPDAIEKYKRLVREAQALYQSHHYRDYHFLLTLSDNVMGLGQEHHESSDDRIPANGLSDPNRRLLGADLLPHEFTHSWNGQYRRPVGLATPDFQQPMKGDLLWVYEGLTTYLGTVLAARSGLWTADQAREHLAEVASTLDHRAGRNWRSLENTSRAAQILYFAPSEWVSYRRGTDFYPESVLIWLEADVTIRKLTQGRRSLDDFCSAFLGGSESTPTIKTYTFDDLVAAMNNTAAYDWRTFFRDRLDSTSAHAPLGGLRGGGWQLTYDDEPNPLMVAAQAAFGVGDYTSSIGLVIKGDGTVQDAIPGMPAYENGISPYTRIMGINGHQFSIDELNSAIANSHAGGSSITLLVANAGLLESHEVAYHDGLRYPHLVRNRETDYLDQILRPRVGH
jgi:predicted metalloprotease with PDZ domain